MRYITCECLALPLIHCCAFYRIQRWLLRKAPKAALFNQMLKRLSSPICDSHFWQFFCHGRSYHQASFARSSPSRPTTAIAQTPSHLHFIFPISPHPIITQIHSHYYWPKSPYTSLSPLSSKLAQTALHDSSFTPQHSSIEPTCVATAPNAFPHPSCPTPRHTPPLTLLLLTPTPHLPYHSTPPPQPLPATAACSPIAFPPFLYRDTRHTNLLLPALHRRTYPIYYTSLYI